MGSQFKSFFDKEDSSLTVGQMFCVDDFNGGGVSGGTHANSHSGGNKEIEREGSSSNYESRDYGDQSLLGKSKSFLICKKFIFLSLIFISSKISNYCQNAQSYSYLF
jgi:hypothetical protein